jgi:hypothetical protein
LRQYLQDSLFNLQEAWEAEFGQLHLLLSRKLSKLDLQPLEEKLSDLGVQVEAWTHLNSIKVSNLSYGSTSKSTPFRVNFERSSILEQESNPRFTKDSEEGKAQKKHLKYCSSLSALGRPDEPKESKGIEEMTEKQWRKKAAETLGLAPKRIRRQRS